MTFIIRKNSYNRKLYFVVVHCTFYIATTKLYDHHFLYSFKHFYHEDLP